MTYASHSHFSPSSTDHSSYASHRANAPSMDLDLLASLSTFPAPPSHIPASPNPNATGRFPPSSFASGSGTGSRRPSDSSIRSKESGIGIGRPQATGGTGPGLPPSEPLPPLPPPSLSNSSQPSGSLSMSLPTRPPSSASIRQSAPHGSHSKAKSKPSPLALSLSQPPSARSSAYSEKSELPYAKRRASSHSASPSISSTRSFDAPSVSACGSTSGGSSGPNSRQNSLYRVSSVSSSSQHHNMSGLPSNGQLYANPPHSPTFSVRSGMSTVSVAESLRNRLAEFGSINLPSGSSNNASPATSAMSNVPNLAGIGAFGARRGSAESNMTFGGPGVATSRSSMRSNTSRGSRNSRSSLASSTSKGSQGSRSSSSFGNSVSAHMREDHFTEESEADGDYDEFGVEMKGKSRRSESNEADGELEREMEALEESLLRAPMLSGLASLSPSPSPSPIPPPPPLSLRIPKSKDNNKQLSRTLESGDDESRTPTLTSSTSSGTLNSANADGEVRTPLDGAPLGTSARLERGIRKDRRAKVGLGLGLNDTKEKPLPSVPPLESDLGSVVTELEVERPKFEMAICEPSPVRAEYHIQDKKMMTPAVPRSTIPNEKANIQKEESEDGSDDFDFPMPPSSVPPAPMKTPARPTMTKRSAPRERSNTATSSISTKSTASASSSKLERTTEERPSRSSRREVKGGASSPELGEMILRTSLSTPRAKSKSKSRSRATSRVRSRKSDVMSEESLLFGPEPLLNEGSGSGSSSRGHGEERFARGRAEWDSEEEDEEIDSDIDIHTPLPHILLREGVLSPHSRVLASSMSALDSRPASVLTMATVASDVSRLSVTTKSGLVLMRDTEVRRVRHRDGKTLREGLGLTTGLGWSDSEDDEVDVRTWASSPGVSRQASMASMSSFKSGRSGMGMQRRVGMTRSASASAHSVELSSPPLPPMTPHTAPPSSFNLNKRPKTPVSIKPPVGRSVSAGQLGRVSSIASSVASSTYSGRERDSLFSSASGSSGESYGSRITMSTSSGRKGSYASSPKSLLSQSTSAMSSSTCVRTPLSLPRKQHTIPKSAPRPGLSQSLSHGSRSQSLLRTPSSHSQTSSPLPESQKTLPRMASSSALSALGSKSKVPSRSVGFGRVAREQAVRGTVGRAVSTGQVKK
ncbi:hypothetical protein SCHPADRAFT_888084 [Schizopora paradoxa]|uniref:Uncharacterized protein n=1 Tax=Schizopora paradoxa TaxID=27342 RepID=A0A0H2SG72_9AGAM|nr:hypothetical protein SCHPADRAFT_888084 [Schizopora paradoxa]